VGEKGLKKNAAEATVNPKKAQWLQCARSVVKNGQSPVQSDGLKMGGMKTCRKNG